MIVLLQDAAGHHQTVHRHYLLPDGRKALLDPPKATAGPLRGAFATVDPIGPEMVVGEGVESSASAGQLFSLPALAGIAAGNLVSIDLPRECAQHRHCGRSRRDRPPHREAAGPGRRLRCRGPLGGRGRRMQVALPDREGVDVNDPWMGQLGVVVTHG